MDPHAPKFMTDDLDFEFDNSPAADVRRWLDVLSHQLALISERLLNHENPIVLTGEGERVVGQLHSAYHALCRGEMVDGDHVRRLLDLVMNSRQSVFMRRSTILPSEPARPQERAEANNQYIRHNRWCATIAHRSMDYNRSEALFRLALQEPNMRSASAYHFRNGVMVDGYGLPVPLFWYYDGYGILRWVYNPSGWRWF